MRSKRLLWANVYCLLDVSSGASKAVRQMLLQLHARGWQVDVLGATVFDHPHGTVGLKGYWQSVSQRHGEVVTVIDGPLHHTLLVTAHTERHQMTNKEEGQWFGLYLQWLDQNPPDAVYFYGGQPFDQLIAAEARHRGIPVVFYLGNGNYTHERWCREVNLILTDTHATARLYRQRLGINVTPVGAFIDPFQVVASQRSPERLLFVNPSPEKGGLWVVCLAQWLERHRPDLILEVIESRSEWSILVQAVHTAQGLPDRQPPRNVIVTPAMTDMRPVYARAKILLAPSLWWESGGRVGAEAMLNGIPVVCTDRGGLPEMVQDAGVLLSLAAIHHEPPHNKLPTELELESMASSVVSLWDDSARYQRLSDRARELGRVLHSLDTNTERLLSALESVISASEECPGG